MSLPTVSVIIPCKQAERTLDLCLSSLCRQTEPALEIILVNDGSTDRTAEIAARYPVKILNTSGGTGAGAARKTGAEVAQGEILAFIDSDCEAPADWIAKIKHHFANNPDLGAVGGGYTHPPMRGVIGKLVALEEEYIYRLFRQNPTRSNPPGGNTALPKKLWKRPRTSRELYYFRGMASGEDSVFCEELRSFADVRFDHEMSVCHHTNEANRYFVRHVNRGRSRMAIRLYKLASAEDNSITLAAYGGMPMVWASFSLWLFLASFLILPFSVPVAATVGIASLIAHFVFSHDYFSFAKQQMVGENRIRPLENLLIRGALGLRLGCWTWGTIRAVKQFVARNVSKWINVGLSILHFWRPGKVSKLFFFVTAKCNARCSFCFNLDNVVNWEKRKPTELTLEEITKLAKNFKRLPYLTLSGGEPFLRKDLVDVIEAFHIHAKTQWVTIPSNAALTETSLEKTVQILNRCPNLFLTVQASLDSLGIDHDKSRNIKDGFRKMEETLQGWSRLCGFYPNLRIQLATAYDDFNQARINEIIQYNRDHFNVHQQILYLIRDAHTTITQSNNHLMPSYFRLIDNINEYEAARSGSTNDFWHRVVRTIQKQVNHDIFFIKKNKEFLRPCHATSKFFTLYDDGQVSPCEVLDQTSLGNVRDYDFDYYALKKARDVRQYYKQTIVKAKCNCDWTCATPINMLYDVKSLGAIAKGFFSSKPLSVGEAFSENETHREKRTYNQSDDTWTRVQAERAKTERHVTSKPSGEMSAPPPSL